ncbi:vanadium-dependent haloperoxidase [Granulosicoccus antarcticus]|uniref:DUF6851 domain-containing protein n=1 Tax=Granulosicoccus antarcticus IMCC3135 TaxID=1192854 RepID=A0A2Z2NJ75_9GAMM|nr:vanadium-dependent haloperoxidase [Granulosicoccus antarcticus]ASJ71219.1 hypothetical protein IMCC3135_05535 [Granulosicoccus antarcticus IMCC3135]
MRQLFGTTKPSSHRCWKFVPAGVLVFVCTNTSLVAHAQVIEPPEVVAPAYDPTLSIARNWNEALLYAIRRDLARPTVHARNLFHTSIAFYDAWAAYDDTASPYLLGRAQRNGFNCALSPATRTALQAISETDKPKARETAMSFAAYRLLHHRFGFSPGADDTLQHLDELFATLGLNADDIASDLTISNRPEVLGNAIAQCLIDYGNADGSNEQEGYSNLEYLPINTPLDPTQAGNPGLSDPNRWQPLQLDTFIDQSGNVTTTPSFLGAEWAQVATFSLTAADLSQISRDGQDFPVYLDPGLPAQLGDDPSSNQDYQWNHALVALWSAQLSPADGVMWDISPGSLGNSLALPDDSAALQAFYDPLEGGSADLGHAINPATGNPYAEQLVPRGDYTRVLAEFWADGPDSETPPGHWFRIYNQAVSDHPDFKRRFSGQGDEVDALSFDVKTYFLLGAAMHDSAIAAWSNKGAYDYIRPISAIRYMASLGQSTDIDAANYHAQGIPLTTGLIESVAAGDPLAGNGGRDIGKIKVRAWRGPAFIRDPASDTAGVGWILLENWWPYQRPTFVTPPFAGYVSGHSTFSRAAAEILTNLTGDEFFPGGMAEFKAKKDEFLVFEQGPSVDITLQWATYRDASDQTSLSRIWGGIHPPVDDVPGRLMGIKVAERVWTRTDRYFSGNAEISELALDYQLYPELTPEPSNQESRSSSGCSIAPAYITGAQTNQSAFKDPLLLILVTLSGVGLCRRKLNNSKAFHLPGEQPDGNPVHSCSALLRSRQSPRRDLAHR